MMWRIMVAAVVVLSLVLLALWLGLFSDPPDALSEASIPDIVLEAPASNGRDSQRPGTDLEAVSTVPFQRDDKPPTCHVKAIDEQGDPVPGATVYLTGSKARYVLRKDAAIIGKTDASGVLEVPLGLQVDDDEGRVVNILAEGYTHASVFDAEPEARYEVTLYKAARAVIDCRRRDGRAVSGVQVLLSKTTIGDSSKIDEEALPSGTESGGVFVAVSDKSGRAIVRNLVPGDYMMRISHPWFLAVSRSEWSSVTVPPEEYSVVLSELFVASASVKGDEIISSGKRIPVRGIELPSDGVSGAVRSFYLQIRSTRLKEKYPGSAAFVFLPILESWEDQPEEGPRIPVTLRLRRRGSVTIEVASGPLRTFKGPLPVELPEPTSEAKYGRVKPIRVLLPGDECITLKGFSLSQWRSGGAQLKADEDTLVRAGTYRLLFAFAGAWPELNKKMEIEVVAGQTIEKTIRLSRAVRLVALSVRGPYRDSFSAASVTLRGDDRTWHTMRATVQGARYLVPLPVGSHWEVTAKALGYQPTVKRFTVDEAAGDQPLLLECLLSH